MASAYNKANAGEKLVGYEKNDRFHIILDGNRHACHAPVSQQTVRASPGSQMCIRDRDMW